MSRIQPVSIANTVLGDGTPKICVPAVAEDKEQFDKVLEVLRLERGAYDLVEWRADIEIGKGGDPDIKERVEALREAAGEKAILFTIRTAAEGGDAALAFGEYADKCTEAAKYADLVDIELFSGEEQQVAELVKKVHGAGARVIMSSHDFGKTPSEEEITGRLCRMQELGADITKLAVMPQSEEDVLTLLTASVKMKNEKADRPFVTMSMGSLGRVSRLCGGLTGSAVTFASAGKASAPGQVEAGMLSQILRILE